MFISALVLLSLSFISLGWGLFTSAPQGETYSTKTKPQQTSPIHLISGLRITTYEYLGVLAGSLTTGALLGWYLNNWIIALAGLYLGYKAPRKLLLAMERKRKGIMAKQMEPALQQIANLFRISQNVQKAIEEATTTMASPLKEEFLLLEADLKVAGMSLEQALERLSQRLSNPDFDFFAKVALLSQSYGGETKEVMLQIPQTIRERQMIRAELETELAGAKQQSWFLLAGTPLFFAVYKIMRPDFAKILTTTAMGKFGMSIVAGLTIISLLLIEKISEPVS